MPSYASDAKLNNACTLHSRRTVACVRHTCLKYLMADMNTHNDTTRLVLSTPTKCTNLLVDMQLGVPRRSNDMGDVKFTHVWHGRQVEDHGSQVKDPLQLALG